MEFTGRITSNAKVNTLPGNKQVVNFSVAINNSYRKKGTGEVKQQTTFIDVARWFGTGIAPLLTKGAIVTVSGFLFPDGYIDMKGEARASIKCTASDIRVHQSGKSAEKAVTPVPASVNDLTEPLEDLPF